METQHIIANFRKNPRIIGSLDMHSYGQLLLRPYGKTTETAEHENIHKTLGNEMVTIIKKVSTS